MFVLQEFGDVRCFINILIEINLVFFGYFVFIGVFELCMGICIFILFRGLPFNDFLVLGT